MRASLLVAAILSWGQISPAIASGEGSRAVLVIDEPDPSTGVPTLFSTTLRGVLIEAHPHVAVYAETLDFTHFTEPRQEAALRNYLQEKYNGAQFGAIVAVGASALGLAMRWRPDLWRGTPIVFGAVDELSLSRITLEDGVTGFVMRRTIRSMVDAARLAVPGLKGVAVLGGSLQPDAYRRQYLKELPLLAKDVAVTNLTGRPLGEQLEHARTLPEDAAILYTSLFIDDAGTRYSSEDALAEIARVANRPIIIDVASLVGWGATGGFAINNLSYGEQVAALVLRVVDGADVSAIPVTVSEYTRPVFDHRQLKRWRISEASLPPGSEVRFREPTIWEQHGSLVIGGLLAVALQSALIAALLVQRRQRRQAEVEAERRSAELAQAARLSLAGELTASIAHEISQPLGAILANAGAAEALLRRDRYDSDMLRQIVAEIRKEDLRASDIIRHVRGLVVRHEVEREPTDVNALVVDVLAFLSDEASRRGIRVDSRLAADLPLMNLDRVQLQQALVNLCVNAMDAMADTAAAERLLTISTRLQPDGGIEVRVSDRGLGISAEQLPRLFDSFFTTKPHGTGLGLSITRSIVEAHGGTLSAENRACRGAAFIIALPLSENKTTAPTMNNMPMQGMSA